MSKMNKILKSSLIVSIYLFVIKLFGLIKQSVIASIYGTTVETDIFFVSSGIVSSIGVAIFSSLSITLLTLYIEKKSKSVLQANKLISDVLKVFIPISFLLTVFFVLNSDIIARWIAPNYKFEQFKLLTQYIRIMSISLCPLCYYLIINSVLEANQEFIPGRTYALFQNLFIIIAALFFMKLGIMPLLIAFILAALAECLLVTVRSRKYFSFINSGLSSKTEIKELLYLAVPLMIGNAIYEINDIVDKTISVRLGEGGVSFLTYGQSLNEIVSVIVISAVSTVLFSHYAKWVVNKEYDNIVDSVSKCVKVYVIIMIPITILTIICNQDIVKVFFGRGNFSDSSVVNTSRVLIGYAIGFAFICIRSVFLKCLYAFKDTKRTLWTGVIAISLNIILSITLSRICGVSGVALGTSVAMFISMILNFYSLKKHLPNLKIEGLFICMFKVFVASICMTLVALFIRKNVLQLNLYLRLIIIGCLSLGTYMLLIILMSKKPLKH